jgi:hypothetical protein
MECSICLCEGESFENANLCSKEGHQVCETCMRDWKEASRSRRKDCTCPVCRELVLGYIEGYEPGYMWEGTVVVRYPDGQVKREATYRRGFMIGCERVWYPTGRLMYECEYGEEHLHGVFTYWNPDGTVWFSCRYDQGRVVEESRLVDLRGR